MFLIMTFANNALMGTVEAEEWKEKPLAQGGKERKHKERDGEKGGKNGRMHTQKREWERERGRQTQTRKCTAEQSERTSKVERS